jgi:hypothetical protein
MPGDELPSCRALKSFDFLAAKPYLPGPIPAARRASHEEDGDQR